MKILGIETSCDESAAAVAEFNGGSVRILSNAVSSQIEIHKKYGGVVPEVAAREHVLNILPVVNEALFFAIPASKSAGIQNDLAEKSGIPARISTQQSLEMSKKINAIAVTIGPGLITSLVTGIETAKTLAYAWNIPVIGINHIEGHIYANFINIQDFPNTKNKPATHDPYPLFPKHQFPAIILTVSGGHTMLVLMEGHGRFKTIGETRDDAAGEAFDKAAKLLGIGYPGGPAVAAEAAKFSPSHCEKPRNKPITLPRPMIDSNDFEFSFSGLKTALRYKLEKDTDWESRIPEYCHEFQQAVIDVLVAKTLKAAQKFQAQIVMLSGGVSANTELRAQLAQAVKNQLPGCQLLIPDLKYTTDNAAMIAAAGCFKADRQEFTPWPDLHADCNLKL